MISYSIAALLIIIIDQVTKILVSSSFTSSTVIHLIPGIINIVYLKNTGAAFSMFSDHVDILGIISAVFCIGVIIYVLITKPKNKLQLTSLTLIFAGALGNAIDRIFRGFVIDFIETAFISFPVFNIADIAITIGAFLLVIYVIFFDKESKEK